MNEMNFESIWSSDNRITTGPLSSILKDYYFVDRITEDKSVEDKEAILKFRKKIKNIQKKK